jgi:hypothetical protein
MPETTFTTAPKNSSIKLFSRRKILSQENPLLEQLETLSEKPEFPELDQLGQVEVSCH